MKEARQTMMNWVAQIESGQVLPPNYPNYSLPSFSTSQTPNYSSPIRRTSASWTLREHKLFLLGVYIFGWGKWKQISETVVMTRTAAQLASHAQKFRERGIETRVKRRGSIHDITLADISPEDWNDLLSSLPHLKDLLSSLPHLMPHHSLPTTQQLQSQIHQPYQAATPVHHVLPPNQLGTHMNNHSLPMNHLGTQISPSLQHSDQTDSPIHHVLLLNEPQNPSGLQLESQIPSSLHQPHQATTPVRVLLPNQLGTQMNPIHHHHHSLPMDHLGTQIPSRLQLQKPLLQPNSQVLSQSLSRNQGDQSESQFSYDANSSTTKPITESHVYAMESHIEFLL